MRVISYLMSDTEKPSLSAYLSYNQESYAEVSRDMGFDWFSVLGSYSNVIGILS